MSAEPWLTSLLTATAQAGYELAIKLSRMAVKITQPSDDVRRVLRPIYEKDVAALIASSHVVAVQFAIIAAATDYWQCPKGST